VGNTRESKEQDWDTAVVKTTGRGGRDREERRRVSWIEAYIFHQASMRFSHPQILELNGLLCSSDLDSVHKGDDPRWYQE
jgi:hypothetical protein